MTDLGSANTSPFERRFSFDSGGISHSVFVGGSGPGVLLMHELPGMSPDFWRLANWLGERFTVWAPDLFGNTEVHTPANPARLLLRACISREIYLFSRNDPGPITQWLRALSRRLHEKVGGQGVGVVGLCMTGNFSLTLALDPWVIAPVTSEPGIPASLPLRNQDGGLQMNTREREKLANSDVDVMGLRFKGDKLCTAARFDTIRSVVGAKRFQEHVIADEHANKDLRLSNPHSVLTADLVDEKDSVTKLKLLEVIRFLEQRLVAE